MNPGITPTDYIVNILDDQGCTATDTVNVMWDLYILNFQTNTTNVVPCYGDAAGTINISADSSYGFNPYTYTVLDMSGLIINSVSSSDTTFNLLAGEIYRCTRAELLRACVLDCLKRHSEVPEEWNALKKYLCRLRRLVSHF